MTSAPDDDRSRTLRLLCWTMLVVPIALFVALAIIHLILTPDLGASVATHWNAAGRADGFGPAWTYPVMTVTVGAGVTALVGGLGLSGATRSGASINARMLTAPALTARSADSAEARIMVWLIVVDLFAVAAGVIGWMVTPKILGTRRDRNDHAALNLAPTERVV
ncbi:MAG: DUF1648 domain-containing protein, partial [Microbacterium sp.]